jgi:hypothetical protein
MKIHNWHADDDGAAPGPAYALMVVLLKDITRVSGTSRAVITKTRAFTKFLRKLGTKRPSSTGMPW